MKFVRGQRVSTPKGLGTVSMLSQRKADSRVNVFLDNGKMRQFAAGRVSPAPFPECELSDIELFCEAFGLELSVRHTGGFRSLTLASAPAPGPAMFISDYYPTISECLRDLRLAIRQAWADRSTSTEPDGAAPGLSAWHPGYEPPDTDRAVLCLCRSGSGRRPAFDLLHCTRPDWCPGEVRWARVLTKVTTLAPDDFAPLYWCEWSNPPGMNEDQAYLSLNRYP